MDPTHPGRGADASYADLLYTNVVQTNANGAFKVYLPFDGAGQIDPAGRSLVHDFALGRLA